MNSLISLYLKHFWTYFIFFTLQKINLLFAPFPNTLQYNALILLFSSVAFFMSHFSLPYAFYITLYPKSILHGVIGLYYCLFTIFTFGFRLVGRKLHFAFTIKDRMICSITKHPWFLNFMMSQCNKNNFPFFFQLPPGLF